MPSHVIQITFPEDEWEQLKAVKAAEGGTPIAVLVRRAVRAWLGPAPSDGERRHVRRLSEIDREKGIGQPA